jgi:hypothetical protein
MNRNAILTLLLLGFLPVWRCGLREKLSFYEFVIEHTIFSPHEVSYIPEELLTREALRG